MLTGQQDAARRLIEDAGEHGDQLIPLSAQVAAALVLAGRVPEAKQTIADSAKEIKAGHLIEIADWLVADSRPADAVRLSRTLLAGQDLERAFAAITRALADKGKLADARRVAVAITDPGQKAVAFAALASAAAAQPQTKDAERFLAVALEQARQADEAWVTHVPLATALASLRGASEVVDFARRTIDPLRHVALVAAFDRFMQRGKTADAEAVERAARELLYGAPSEEGSGYCQIAADSNIYKRARSGGATEAVKAAAVISDPWERMWTFSCLSVLFADSGRPRESRLAVRQAVAAAEATISSPGESSAEEGLHCGGDEGPVSYDFLVDAIVKAQDIDEVRRIAATFPNGSHRGFMLALAAAALWRTGDTGQAERHADAAWIAYSDGPGGSVMAGDTVLWILAEGGLAWKAGQIARAAERSDLGSYFPTSLRQIGRFRDAYDFEHYLGIHDKVPAPEPAILALVRAGRLNQAVSYVRQFDDSPLKVKVLARAAIRYMRAVPINSPD